MGTSVKMNNSNLDEIRIDNLEVYANHGVFPEETALGQTFYINAVLYMETRESGLTDNLSVSVNYGEVCHFMNDFMKKHITMIGCPKLDTIDYAEKLSVIFKTNNIRTITVVRMTVPCCGGLSHAVATAIKQSGKDIPLRIVTISPDGRIIK